MDGRFRNRTRDPRAGGSVDSALGTSVDGGRVPVDRPLPGTDAAIATPPRSSRRGHATVLPRRPRARGTGRIDRARNRTGNESRVPWFVFFPVVVHFLKRATASSAMPLIRRV